MMPVQDSQGSKPNSRLTTVHECIHGEIQEHQHLIHHWITITTVLVVILLGEQLSNSCSMLHGRTRIQLDLFKEMESMLQSTVL